MTPGHPRLVILALAAATMLVGPAGLAATPQGFPEQVVLPRGLHPVFLVSFEETYDRLGVMQSQTVVFETQQAVSDGRKIQRHFARLFRRLGWAGQFQPDGARSTGSFTDGDVVVDVGVAAAGTGRASIVVRVPVH